MKISLSSPVPGFQKELLDIANLFLGSPNRVEASEADLVIEITEEVHNGLRTCAVSLKGLMQGRSSNAQNIFQDSLYEKRMRKRQQKLALFQAFVMVTGYCPPWGSLTGVRPTRLVLEEMAQGKPLLDAADAVQQRFSLSDEKTKLLIDTLRFQETLPLAKSNEVSCYIGIPFCVSRCRYCSFVSREVGDGSLLFPYTKALIKEIKSTIGLIRQEGLMVRTLYIGGGTPTALPDHLLEQVMEAAGPLIAQAGEVTVEAGRPDTITPGNLKIIRNAGTRRISVNPQTMHDDTLQRIGRRHTKQQTDGAFALARQAGFDHINMDLIAGLPGETEAMFAQTLDWVLSLLPESITVHTLSLKRSSDMYRYTDQLHSGADVSRMVSIANQRLLRQDYLPYYLYRQKHMAENLENVGYAKPGHACLYNIDMMEDQTTVLAMGAGAISKRVWPQRERIERAPNVKNPEHYIARVDEMIQRKTDLFQGA